MSHRSTLFIVALAIAPLTACVDPAGRENVAQSPLVTPPMMNTRPASFQCDDSGRVVVRPLGEDGRTIVLAFINRELQLKTVEDQQGHKYSDGQNVFWMNGDTATLLRAGEEDPELRKDYAARAYFVTKYEYAKMMADDVSIPLVALILDLPDVVVREVLTEAGKVPRKIASRPAWVESAANLLLAASFEAELVRSQKL